MLSKFFQKLVGQIFFNSLKRVSFISKNKTPFYSPSPPSSDESQNLLEIIVSALAHDLSNPLQSAVLITNLAEEGRAMSPDKIKKLSQSLHQMSHILKSLKNVAATSKNGKFKLNSQSHSVSQLIQEAILAVQSLAQRKKIRLKFQNSSSFDIKIFVDREIFIYQVLVNIVNNAIKFSNISGEILLTYNYIESQNAVQIIVQDWGTGIETMRLRKLFSWSELTSTPGTLGEPGSGLGLPIAYKFLNHMSGKIQLNSSCLKSSNTSGTRVTITLPVFEKIESSQISA